MNQTKYNELVEETVNASTNDPQQNKSQLIEYTSYTVGGQSQQTINLQQLTQKILKEIFVGAFPISASLLLFQCLQIINAHYIGYSKISTDIGILGFAQVFGNIFGFAFFESCNNGFYVFGSQAFGNKKYQILSVYYQKSIIMNIILFCFVLLIFGVLRWVLIAIQIKPHLAIEAQKFLFVTSPALLLFSFYDLTKNLLNCQKNYYIAFFILLVTVPFHFLWCYCFVQKLGLSLYGAAISNIITQALNCLLMFLYFKIAKPFPQLTFIWDKLLFINLFGYFKQNFVTGGSQYLDGMFSQLMTMIVGYLSATSLAVHVCFNSIYSLFGGISYGIGAVFINQIGIQLGLCQEVRAFRIAKIGMALIIFIAIFVVLLFAIFASIWPYWLTKDINTIERIQQIQFLLYLAIIPDFLQFTNNCILKGFGLEKKSFLTVGICYYCIGLPLLLVLTFALNLQLYGIWCSFICSTILIAITELVIIFKLPIKKQRKRIIKSLIDKQSEIDSQTQNGKQENQSQQVENK